MSRRYQFSLRFLMVVVLVVAAFFAGMSVQRRQTERMRMLAEDERALARAERNKAVEAEREARMVAEQLSAELIRAQSKLLSRTREETTDGE
jgi:hypothetical protein